MASPSVRVDFISMEVKQIRFESSRRLAHRPLTRLSMQVLRWVNKVYYILTICTILSPRRGTGHRFSPMAQEGAIVLDSLATMDHFFFSEVGTPSES